jgi:uncharacterized iron-regulated membrane protein
MPLRLNIDRKSMKAKTKLFKYSRLIHKWAGLILGIQLLLWISGGVVMSVLPGDKVHGNHLVNREHKGALPQSAYQYPVDALVRAIDGPIESIRYTRLLNQPVYRVNTDQGEQLFNAVNGRVVEKLSEQQISALAQSYYIGEGQLSSQLLLNNLPQEIRGRASPMWQIQFNDWIDTTLYLSPKTGALVRVRSDIWRVYDFFWMLHIMDYSEREDSHNWMLIFFSLFGFVFAVTGVILFFQVFKKRDFKWKKSPVLQQLKD